MLIIEKQNKNWFLKKIILNTKSVISSIYNKQLAKLEKKKPHELHYLGRKFEITQMTNEIQITIMHMKEIQMK